MRCSPSSSSVQTEDVKLGGLALLAGVETFGGVPLTDFKTGTPVATLPGA